LHDCTLPHLQQICSALSLGSCTRLQQKLVLKWNAHSLWSVALWTAITQQGVSLVRGNPVSLGRGPRLVRLLQRSGPIVYVYNGCRAGTRYVERDCCALADFAIDQCGAAALLGKPVHLR